VKKRVDLAVVVNGFPRLSETFVLHELLEFERRGARLHVIALRRPEETVTQEAVGRLVADVEYLPAAPRLDSRLALRAAHGSLLLRSPRRYLDAMGTIARSPDFSRTNLRRALLMAHRLVQLGSPKLYVHFAHKPATIGRFAALLAGVPYGLSAHAKDIWTTPVDELRQKVRDAQVVLTCTDEGRDHLHRLAGGRTPVHLVHHGVETEVPRAPARPNPVPVIFAAGRLVAKKGFETILRAAALAHRRGCVFRLRIAGEGPEWPTLQRLVHELDIDEQVSFLGPLTESEVRAEYARADLFALGCEVLANGDRDGIPNVIVEAMAHGLPVLSTTRAGVAEAVADGWSGLLSEQGDAAGLADRLERLLRDVELRRMLGANARRRAMDEFDRARNLSAVVDALGVAGLLGFPDERDTPEMVGERLRTVA
jgi:glycosyltransferase involved in cell wall biosynthesis